MDTTRATRLGWTVTTDTSSWIEWIAEDRKLLHDPNQVPGSTRSILHHFQLLSWFSYVDGPEESTLEYARGAVNAATEYFFGVWRSVGPSGNYRNEPPNPTWWHAGDFFKLRDCTESMMLASTLNDWPFIERLAKHMIAIPWQNIRDGREENSLRMVLAGIIAGIPLSDKRIVEFIKKIMCGNKKKEKLLLRFLIAIVEGDDAELQTAADAYFDYFLKVESKKTSITNKIMIEGTLWVNLARHRGRQLIVPEKIGERYVSLPAQ